MEIKRGDIYYADLRPVIGSEQGGVRPVLIVQNNVGNHYSPTVIAAAITSRQKRKSQPTHVELSGSACRLKSKSTVMLEQVRTIDCDRLKDYVCSLDADAMKDIDHAIAVSFGLDNIMYPAESEDLNPTESGERKAERRNTKGDIEDSAEENADEKVL